jgi:hypothetical protein
MLRRYVPQVKVGPVVRIAGRDKLGASNTTADQWPGTRLADALRRYRKSPELLESDAEQWDREGWISRTLLRAQIDRSMADHGYCPPPPDYSARPVGARHTKGRRDGIVLRRHPDAIMPPSLTATYAGGSASMVRLLALMDTALLVQFERMTPPTPAPSRGTGPSEAEEELAVAVSDARCVLAVRLGVHEDELADALKERKGDVQREALQAIREGLRQDAVAGALGVTDRTIHNWKTRVSGGARKLEAGPIRVTYATGNSRVVSKRELVREARRKRAGQDVAAGEFPVALLE